MKLVCRGIVLVLLGASPAAQETSRITTPDAGLDLSPLIEELVRQQPALTGDLNLGYRVRRNVVHVTENRLNRRRFLTEPTRQEVADRMEELLELNRSVGALLGETRHLVAGLRSQDPVSAGRRARALAGEISASAERIRSRFAEFFLEPGPHSIQMALPTDRRLTACLALYLLNAERLHRRLTTALTDFVHGSEPYRVSVDSLDAGSIRVLAKGLRVLSDRTCELIDRGQ